MFHHLMPRGLKRRFPVRHDRDRADLLRRLETIVEATGLCVLAWALLPNRFHLLVRTGSRPLATAMRRLLMGYAVWDLGTWRIYRTFRERAGMGRVTG